MFKKPKFEFYTRPNGINEFIEFCRLWYRDALILKKMIKLGPAYNAQVSTAEVGLLVAQRMEWIKKVDNDIFEIRSKVSSNIQRALYFHVTDERYIITHGFTKKTQKTPTNEIIKAKKYRADYLHRKED